MPKPNTTTPGGHVLTIDAFFHSIFSIARQIETRAGHASRNNTDRDCELARIAALARKLTGILRWQELLSQLEGGKKLFVRKELLDGSSVQMIIVGACRDYQSYRAPDDIRFSLLNEHNLASFKSHLDENLFQVLMRSLIDNAFAFSARDTTVCICFRTAQERLIIQIGNKGLGLRPEDLDNLTRKGWRSDEAKCIQPEGIGYGLWVAQKLADSMDVRLKFRSDFEAKTFAVDVELPIYKPAEPQHPNQTLG